MALVSNSKTYASSSVSSAQVEKNGQMCKSEMHEKCQNIFKIHEVDCYDHGNIDSDDDDDNDCGSYCRAYDRKTNSNGDGFESEQGSKSNKNDNEEDDDDGCGGDDDLEEEDGARLNDVVVNCFKNNKMFLGCHNYTNTNNNNSNVKLSNGDNSAVNVNSFQGHLNNSFYITTKGNRNNNKGSSPNCGLSDNKHRMMNNNGNDLRVQNYTEKIVYNNDNIQQQSPNNISSNNDNRGQPCVRMSNQGTETRCDSDDKKVKVKVNKEKYGFQSSSFAGELERQFEASRNCYNKRPKFSFDQGKRCRLKRILSVIFMGIFVVNVLVGIAIPTTTYFTKLKVSVERNRTEVEIRSLGIRMRHDPKRQSQEESLRTIISWANANEGQDMSIGYSSENQTFLVDAVQYDPSNGQFRVQLDGFYHIFCLLFFKPIPEIKVYLQIRFTTKNHTIENSLTKSSCGSTSDKDRVCQSTTFVKMVYLEKGNSVAVQLIRGSLSEATKSYFLMHVI